MQTEKKLGRRTMYEEHEKAATIVRHSTTLDEMVRVCGEMIRVEGSKGERPMGKAEVFREAVRFLHAALLRGKYRPTAAAGRQEEAAIVDVRRGEE